MLGLKHAYGSARNIPWSGRVLQVLPHSVCNLKSSLKLIQEVFVIQNTRAASPGMVGFVTASRAKLVAIHLAPACSQVQDTPSCFRTW